MLIDTGKPRKTCVEVAGRRTRKNENKRKGNIGGGVHVRGIDDYITEGELTVLEATLVNGKWTAGICNTGMMRIWDEFCNERVRGKTGRHYWMW